MRENPRLLGYYRLLLGFSQKAFYGKTTGLSGYKRAEDGRGFGARELATLAETCAAINRVAAVLITGIQQDIDANHIDDLSLLTLGPQLRGGWNVGLGATAIRQVFEVIQHIVGESASKVDEHVLELVDSTGRTVKMRLRSDPDIEAVSVNRTTGLERPLLAIEVKGGQDYSNVHNRLGEEEKSHLKARLRGFTDIWTIINVEGIPREVLQRESPTTTLFVDLRDVLARSGNGYDDFREHLLQRLRLPE